MFRSKIITTLLAVFVFCNSCRTQFASKSLEYKDYSISKTIPQDNKLSALIKPYADSVHKSMNDVIATSSVQLDKKQPEGTLGNLMADIMLSKAKEKYATNVDCSIMNFGGIRLPVIPAGDITRGKVFELSPFDNIIVLQVLNGKILQSLLDHMASKKGWPVSGIKMQIKDGKAVNVTINGQPIDSNKNYTLALLDYVANGGDDANMLRSVAQINHGFLYRDAILEYLIGLTKAGKTVTSNIENRVTYAD